MKKIFILMLVMLFISACSNEVPDKTVQDQDDPQIISDPTEEQVQEQLKVDAAKVSFVEVNSDEIEEGTKVKITGVVDVINETGELGTFSMGTTEGDGHGIYTVVNVLGTEIEEGQEVTIYGIYDGKDDLGIPKVLATIIE